MTVSTYLLIGTMIAAWIGATAKIEDGDRLKVIALLLIAALWPVSIGIGVGLIIRDGIKWIRRKT